MLVPFSSIYSMFHPKEKTGQFDGFLIVFTMKMTG
jgi:hypothetical protein